ncbi:hypothetical protein ACIA5G_50855 [Amycolatopsis sp. NPDC051758]|uniref:hypothetical protein n=1 Tax=Amycolatopsis sp. NPDC051758 TaxID=3363935 RepID=UPI00379932FA
MITKFSRVLGQARRAASALNRSSTIGQRLDEARSNADYLLTIELFRLRGMG